MTEKDIGFWLDVFKRPDLKRWIKQRMNVILSQHLHKYFQELNTQHADHAAASNKARAWARVICLTYPRKQKWWQIPGWWRFFHRPTVVN